MPTFDDLLKESGVQPQDYNEDAFAKAAQILLADQLMDKGEGIEKEAMVKEADAFVEAGRQFARILFANK